MTNNTAFNKKRKFLLVLPLLVLPFLTLAFWALGGGKGTLPQTEEKKGFNAALPDAQLPIGPLDKMSMYSQRDKDSLALAEQLRMDPYARQAEMPDTGAGDFGFTQDPVYGSAPGAGGYQYQNFSDPNEARIQRKLSELERSLAEPEPTAADSYEHAAPDFRGQQHLEALMQAASGSQDQEMEQLNGMLEKLIDVQNPQRVQEKLREQSLRSRGQVLAVSRYAEPERVDMLDGMVDSYHDGQTHGFYDLESDYSPADTLPQTGIPAVIHETQTLVSGGAVKMRLNSDVFVSGQRIPAGTFVSGSCSVDGERLKIDITAIRYGKSIYPVSMTAYDLDAIEGVRIPGAMSRDAAKDGTERTLQSLQLMSLNPSLGAQAAGAGLEVAKGFLGRKAKQIRVTVKAGHPLLLVDAKTKQGS